MADIPLEAFRVAAAVPDFTPVAEAAKGVAIIRGENPYFTAYTPWGSLDRWRAIVLETILLELVEVGMQRHG